ncbi:MAG: hypothetical protein AB7F35_20150 [Acetobacteraceae bacterium]
MAGQWILSQALANKPQRIRPETHWFQETTKSGRDDGRLWFSLQLSLEAAEGLLEAFRLSRSEGAEPAQDISDEAACFAKRIEPLLAITCPHCTKRAVTMAPTSYAALHLALEHRKAKSNSGADQAPASFPNSETTEPMLGTDILVHPAAFEALEALSCEGIEVTDAGLAIKGDVVEALLPASVSAQSVPGLIPDGSYVIIATIDDGIGLANHRFRATKDTTRVKHFLDLALVGRPTIEVAGEELLGRSWNDKDINALLGQDEEQVYRALGLIDPDVQSLPSREPRRQPLRAAVTHGTHVLDLAAGYDWQNKTEAATARRRPIIAVQLPAQVAENRSDTWLPQSLKRALDWILVKADELSAEISGPLEPDGKPRRLPLVVNGSFGSLAGPQDGYGDVERRITQFVETYRGNGPDDLCTVVLSVGNALQLRAAAQMDILPGGTGTIPWRVQPDDKTPSFVQIWLPPADDVDGGKQPQQVRVHLVPPSDPPLEQLGSQLDKAVEWRTNAGVLARVYHQRLSRPPHGSRECITISIGPTAYDQRTPVVPSGLWRIRIENISDRRLRDIDLRVHRDDAGMFARSGARQSYFNHPDYQRFDPGSGRTINDERRDDGPWAHQRCCDELRQHGHWTRVTRQGTLSTYASAKGVLAVGGYRRSDGEPAVYSSAGRRQKDAGGKLMVGRMPDLAAVSEESPALPGVLAAGTYSGSVAVLSGTSVAAPQVTRALADRIATRGGYSLVQPAAATERLLKAVRSREISSPSSERYGSGSERYQPHRQLRDGVGRLPLTSSAPERSGDNASARNAANDGFGPQCGDPGSS